MIFISLGLSGCLKQNKPSDFCPYPVFIDYELAKFIALEKPTLANQHFDDLFVAQCQYWNKFDRDLFKENKCKK